MNATLVRSFLALIPVAPLLAWSIGVLSKERTLGPLLAFLGATCLLIVVLTPVAESLHLFAFMHWGDPHSAGHYLDLSSAILAVSLISAGLMLRGRTRPHKITLPRLLDTRFPVPEPIKKFCVSV